MFFKHIDHLVFFFRGCWGNWEKISSNPRLDRALKGNFLHEGPVSSGAWRGQLRALHAAYGCGRRRGTPLWGEGAEHDEPLMVGLGFKSVCVCVRLFYETSQRLASSKFQGPYFDTPHLTCKYIQIPSTMGLVITMRQE